MRPFKIFLGLSAETQVYRFSRLLSMVYVTILMSATVFAYKIVQIHGVSIPASTIIFTSSYFVAMSIAELYGPFVARRVIWEALICGYLFAILIRLTLTLPSPDFWPYSADFDLVLGHILRFTIAGSVGYLISNFLAIFILEKFRILLKSHFFAIRSFCAIVVGEGIATYLVGIMTFWHLMPIHQVFNIMTIAFIYKLILSFIIVWPVSLLIALIRPLERQIYQPKL